MYENPKIKMKSVSNSQVTDSSSYGEFLTFFNTLQNKEAVIRNLTERYYLDMALFGYNVTLNNGSYYATCYDGDMLC